MPECLECGETNFNSNPIFCDNKCKDLWMKAHEKSLDKKLMVRVNPITWIMTSRKKPRKEKRLWKKWMAAGRKLMKAKKGGEEDEN